MNETYGLDSIFLPLSALEEVSLEGSIIEVANEARAHCHKRPKVTTILEEVAEMILAFRGKHHDPPEEELVQIASTCINVLWQLREGAEVNNIVTLRRNP